LKISYFFRSPETGFHSIEQQFLTMQKYLPEDVLYRNVFARRLSKGLLKRILIGFQFLKNQSDINHITGDVHFVALFLRKKKTILTVHDVSSIVKSSGIKRFILELFWFILPFQKVRYVTTVSEFTKSEILSRFKIDPDKIIVVPNCISENFAYREKKNVSAVPVLLQIGTTENKNLLRLIEAISGINCKLIIIGKLSDIQSEYLKKYKINFENYSNLNQSQIIELYTECDLVTFVSTYEGFGVPIIEAQACGKPVITSSLSPMCDVAGKGALLVDPYNISGITEGIKAILSDDILRQRLIQEGFENAKKYSPQQVAMKYCELYQKMAD
jgi:glycosyltransferase involved in cell wall biosynthesis